jgi:phage-related protein
MQVSFAADMALYESVDNYIYTMPKGLNHLQMQISMPFENRKQEEARQIVGFFESLQGTGYFLYTDAAQIYKPVNLFLNSFDNTMIENDIYTLNATLSTDQISNILNWSQPLITGSNIRGNWATATSYQEYDVVRNTGSAPTNFYDSYYYCTGDHTSSTINDTKWTREFDFSQPTYSVQVSKETSVLKTDLPYSFAKRTNFGLHANTLKQFKIDYKGVNDREARCILHFLIARQGYRKFQYKFPKIYHQ